MKSCVDRASREYADLKEQKKVLQKDIRKKEPENEKVFVPGAGGKAPRGHLRPPQLKDGDAIKDLEVVNVDDVRPCWQSKEDQPNGVHALMLFILAQKGFEKI